MQKQNKSSARFHRCGLILALAVPVALASVAVAQGQDSRHSRTAKPEVESPAPLGVVNLNTATEEELTRLPGIGPSRAQAILKLRKQLGKFDRVETLLRVRGIGRKTLRKLRPMLTLQGNTTLQPRAASKRSTATK